MIPAVLSHNRYSPFFITLMTAAMLFLMCPAFPAKAAGENHSKCYRTLAEEALVCRPQFCPGNFYAGGSVSFRLAPGREETRLMGPPQSWLTMTVMDREFPILDLPTSFYTGYRHFYLGPTDYWIITEYTGGMQCCTRYHFFSRPAPGKSVIYLGATTDGTGGLPGQLLFCRNGSLYLEDQDVRFVYFHTPYAESQLLFPRHYQITPFTLSVDNKSFRDQYLQLIKEIEADVEIILGKRISNPTSLLLDNREDVVFSDLLGQLLTKRTILYIYAGDATTGWTKLTEDIRKYYKNDNDLAQLKAEITQILAASPY